MTQISISKHIWFREEEEIKNSIFSLINYLDQSSIAELERSKRGLYKIDLQNHIVTSFSVKKKIKIDMPFKNLKKKDE